ncbi:fimbrial biogenesis chaperone [Avibacterium paragallinarum]|uniref:fimbrial biogenesis chaperone n=1 Tax=Avibacterium paragallinarum TaxID=728 RepID=UPI00021ACF18|nr:fimbria/pilus periplasmic chaperone [Avibacterium paragallinarum]AZI14081.1 molecular chaperone [Avibacterium paragallinarum]QIR11550.1 fimbria/pilus periplasmic chaperone [Avibacterium paragallinarum]QJE09476.1 fimbria/pilus periplasmic chaperone [Avibacterium paragallinarum]QJE11672.1 fimbria/pilus periplasmic chaperone [Avibacterium paragallinarum]QJE13871.1 fimbria/pilus periplasmic chaperone [Avibacterium paragallinarum]
MFNRWLCLCLAFLGVKSFANIVITGTRVVYPSDQPYVNVQLNNVGDVPALMQAWIDMGDPDASPEQINAPFLITPPIARIEGNKGQTLRLTYTGEPLPSDRESIFYLNVMDIPPNPKDKSKNYLQIALRSRIKLFFRPITLSMPLEAAFQQVKWKIVGKQVVAENPTPYYITYSNIELLQGKNNVTLPRAGMVAPFSQASFNVNHSLKQVKNINWTVINDYGGRQTGTSPLQ